jgi:hypothetical protein
MSNIGIPKGAAIAVNDLLDFAKVQPGQEVLILAHVEGMYGSDNFVDQDAISWIQTAVQLKGANASVLWIDEPAKFNAWRVPPIVEGALRAANVMINHSSNIVTEELLEFRDLLRKTQVPAVRNFATTGALLCTSWAQTPWELVSEIRNQASSAIIQGKPWQLTHENGTHLEGKIAAEVSMGYTSRRHETFYWPWPEWVHPGIGLTDVNGTFVYESMLSTWSRYIGISPYFSKPIRLTVKDGRITKIEGGDEAEALRRFLESMKQFLGEGVYDLRSLHFGVHPQARVAVHQCPNILHRRVIDHSHTSNIHIHIGAQNPRDPKWRYWLHCTGDIRGATFKVGDTLVHDRGHLMVLDSAAVKAVAAKYPGRPGLDPVPNQGFSNPYTGW